MRHLLTAGFIGAMALGFCSSGFAQFSAYNDCIGYDINAYDGGNMKVTNFRDPNIMDMEKTGPAKGIAGGYLRDYATGNVTSAYVTMEITKGAILESVSHTSNGNAIEFTNPESDAAKVFGLDENGDKINLGFSASYLGGDPWAYKATFTGLDPAKEYEFVTTANRAGESYAGKRWGKFLIDGVDAWLNESSDDAANVKSLADGKTVYLCGGYNTEAGNIVRWTGIKVGEDGSFSVTSSNVGNELAQFGVNAEQIKGYGMQGFMLREVPEPASLALLGLGGLALLRRRK